MVDWLFRGALVLYSRWMTADIYLTRHGETVFNQEGRYQGQLDSSLTPLGIGQAQAVAGVLALRLRDAPIRLLSSPLGRALHTAEIFADRLGLTAKPETDARLMEVGMGAWDGLTRAEIAERWPDARKGRSVREWMFHGPGGESLDDLVDRLSDLLSDLKARSEHTHVLVTHAVTGRVIRALHSGQPILEVLKSDAPQDAAVLLRPGGAVVLLPSDDYLRRHGKINHSPTASKATGTPG